MSACPPSLPQRRLVELTLQGGKSNGVRVEVPDTTTEVHIAGCTYVRAGRVMVHLNHEETNE